MMIRILLVVLCVVFASPAWSATYYVATTGNDSTGNGSITTPWRNPQKCAEPPIAAGDTCVVRPGSYSTSGPYLIFIATSSGSASGTSSFPITIKAEVPGSITLAQTTRTSPPPSAWNAVTVYVSKPFYVIDGFDIDGSSTVYDTGVYASHSAIGVYASNVTIIRNHIHDIARTQCSDSPYANTGIFVALGLSNVLIDGNWIHTIGRRNVGESGCTKSIFAHDHVIYFKGGTDLTVRRNVFYDSNRGYILNMYTNSTTVHTRYKIVNNIFAGRAASGTPSGHVIMGGVFVNMEFKNNIHYQVDPDLVLQTYNLSASSTGNVISYNTTNVNVTGTNSNFMFGGSTPAGFTQSNNTESAALAFTNALCTASDGGCQNADFTHAPGSSAINAGTSVTGVTCIGTCDQGAFQTFTATAATADVDLIDITYNPANGPIQVGGTAGHTVNCTTSCGTLTVANASKLSSSDSIARLQVSGWTSGECLLTYTITESFNAATGVLTDSANIGGTLNQPVHSYGPLSCTNNCSETGSPTPPTPSHILYELDGDEADTSGNNLPGTRTGGSYVAGKYGQALQGVNGTTVNVTSQYGDGVDPSGQDLTIIVGYEVPAGAELLTRTVMGAAFSSGNNLYVSTIGGTWQVGAQSSGVSISTPSNLPVRAGYNRLFLQVDSTANTVTLTVDNVTGTGGAAKSITPYTLGGDIAFGLPAGFNASVAGAGKWDRAAIYTSLIDPETDWLAWEPQSAPSVGSYSQAGHQWYLMTQDGAGAAIPYLTPNAAAKVVAPGGALLKTQTDCTGGAPCGSMGEKLWYRRDGGEKQLVPDTFTSDEVSFWGPNTFPEMYLGQADCCITGSLTENHGTTQILNVAQPTFALSNDHSITRMSALRWGPNASGVYCFEEQNQNGTALTSVTPEGGACIEVIAVQASGVH